MKKVLLEEAVRGIPKLENEEGKICGECQLVKQNKMSNSKLHHQITSKGLEILHMVLIKPMQVNNVGRKRFIGVFADDFSKSAWINFIKEK